MGSNPDSMPKGTKECMVLKLHLQTNNKNVEKRRVATKNLREDDGDKER